MRKVTTLCIVGLSILLENSAFADPKEIEIKNKGGCFRVFVDEPAGNIFSCKETPKINYKVFDCETRKVLENGDVEAHVHCPDSKHFKIEFRTTKGVVTALLDLKRETKGRQGMVTSYTVHESKFDDKDPHSGK